MDERLLALGGWRADTLSTLRRLIHEAQAGVEEDCKWAKASNPLGVPVWSLDGLLCTGESYKAGVKLTFARGAALADPNKLFNASLEAGTRRAIDIAEGTLPDAKAFKALIRAAVAENQRVVASKKKPAAKKAAKAQALAAPGGVLLLSGGNPQIPKGDGDAPVQAYIAAMPGWKQAVGQRVDALVVSSVPALNKAVRWNSPFYGLAGQGWFLSLHVFTRFVRLTFFRGTSLQPLPPGASKVAEVRYFDIDEEAAADEALFDGPLRDWIQQAAALPGWVP